MSQYTVTGATGQLGRLIIGDLIAGGVPAADITAVVRDPAKATDLADRGVGVRTADYTQPEALATALAGTGTLMFVSGSEAGQRLPQHTAVIDAAKAAGVTRIVYTSLLRADSSGLPLAPEHKATEELLRASGIPFTILRNSWYTENYTRKLTQYLEQGAITAAAGDGRVAAATRADYAAAAVAALTGTGHENTVYELGGTAFTMSDLAEAITEATGTKIIYNAVTPAELVTVLIGAGLDAGTAAFVAALDEGTARGELDTTSTDLADLIGRPSTPLRDAIKAAL
jgi:NAD(P)H dehydrogenase (quinone)